MIRSHLSTVLLVLAVMGVPRPSHALDQQVTPAEAKALFVANFARFTDWPSDSLVEGAPVVFCVIGDEDVASALGDLLQKIGVGAARGWRLERRPRGTKDSAVFKPCQVLYLAAAEGYRHDIVAAVAGTPVLTVSDAPGFADMGGVAQLYTQGSRMRFAINIAAAQQARLRLSAPLLRLARIVREGSSAPAP